MEEILWFLLMLQLFAVHFWLLGRIFRSPKLDYLAYRITEYFRLPRGFYRNWDRIMVFVWLMIGLLILWIHYMRFMSFRKACFLSMTMVEDDGVKEQFARAVLESGLNARKVNELCIQECKNVVSPFIIGIFSPILIVPDWIRENPDMRLIFLHECRHLKNRDTSYKLFMLFMQSVLWYQPLAYLIRYISCRDVEIACDEAVVYGKSEEERAAYGQFLIDSLRTANDRQTFYSAFFYGSKRMMKARIAAVMEEKKKWDVFAGAASVVLILEICCLLGGTIHDLRHTPQYEKRSEEEPVNLYDGYDLPEAFTEEALAEMLALPLLDEKARQVLEEDQYEEEDYADLAEDHRFGMFIPVMPRRENLYCQKLSCNFRICARGFDKIVSSDDL